MKHNIKTKYETISDKDTADILLLNVKYVDMRRSKSPSKTSAASSPKMRILLSFS
jgi:hypothetical protein